MDRMVLQIPENSVEPGSGPGTAMALIIQADRLGQFADSQGVADDAHLLEQRDGVIAEAA